MLVRIPNATVRNKIVEQEIWHIGSSLFYVAQWTTNLALNPPTFTYIPLWTHVRGIPFDLYMQEGLGRVSDLIGLPIEVDEYTQSMSSLDVAHLKMRDNCSKPIPTIAEIEIDNGEIVRISIEYPWTLPLCPYCKELGHLEALCPQAKWCPKPFPQKADSAPSTTKPSSSKPVSVTLLYQSVVSSSQIGSTPNVLVSNSVVSAPDQSGPAVTLGPSPMPSSPSIGSSMVWYPVSPTKSQVRSGNVVSTDLIDSPASSMVISLLGLLIPQDNLDSAIFSKEQITHVLGMLAHPSSRPKPIKIPKKAFSTQASLSNNPFSCLALLEPTTLSCPSLPPSSHPLSSTSNSTTIPNNPTLSNSLSLTTTPTPVTKKPPISNPSLPSTPPPPEKTTTPFVGSLLPIGVTQT